jgi:hypothetical protein
LVDLRPELIDRARRLRACGFTYERIGRTLGVGTSTIFYSLNLGARRRKDEYWREHARGPEAGERMREYRRGYLQRPGVREGMAEYQREYRRRPEVRVSPLEILDVLSSPMTVE